MYTGMYGLIRSSQVEAAGQALPALVDGILATIAYDDLTRDQFNVLVSPLHEAIRATARAGEEVRETEGDDFRDWWR